MAYVGTFIYSGALRLTRCRWDTKKIRVIKTSSCPMEIYRCKENGTGKIIELTENLVIRQRAEYTLYEKINLEEVAFCFCSLYNAKTTLL